MLQRIRANNGVVYYRSPLLSKAGIPHAFSTRIGGISPTPFDSLNLGNPGGCAIQDDYPRIWENYRLLQQAIGIEQHRLLRVHQVHAADVLIAGPGEEFDTSRKADGILLTDPKSVASVRVADCVPVLLARQDGKAVAAVHAGWRGVVAEIVPRAIAMLRAMESNTRVLAAIGPCIGFDAFEVGPEVLMEFDRRFGRAAPIRRREDGKGYVDLRRAVELQLTSTGVEPEEIESTDRCTVTHADEFFSHRRDNGISGRMAALIALPV